MKKLVGVLGGLGPKATAYFMDMLIDNTKADCDQNHIDTIIFNHASIPDRTAYILDNNNDNPVNYIINDAKKLETLGCDFLVMPCNTSHFMYDEIQSNVNIPIINMVMEVCNIINNNDNIKKVGLMATLGTIKSKNYDKYLTKELFIGNEEINKQVMSLIYDKVKRGIKVDKNEFYNVLDYYFDNSCDIVIMGCTELSVIVRDNNLYNDKRIIDSLKLLVDKTIELSK